jgi:acyl-CoA thioester hydrolase
MLAALRAVAKGPGECGVLESSLRTGFAPPEWNSGARILIRSSITPWHASWRGKFTPELCRPQTDVGRKFRQALPAFLIGILCPADYGWPVDPLVFSWPHRVTYAECTLGNHVYHARYLDILEAARGEFFRHLGVPLLRWQEQDTLFPVVECQLRYRAAARYDDLLAIEIRLTDLRRAQFTLAYRVLNQSAVLLEASTGHVCTSVSNQIKRLPEELRQRLRLCLRASATRSGPIQDVVVRRH